MPSKALRVVFAFLSLWFVAASASAQVTVSGVVQSGLSAPIANTLVEFTQGPSVVGSDVSALDGSYSVALPAGVYSLRVTPPGGSGFLPQTQNDINLDQNETLDIILVAQALIELYSGKVVTRSGAALSGATVELTGQDGFRQATTDAAGEFEIESSPTSGQRHFVQKSSSSGNHWRIYFPDVDLSAGPVSGVTLEIEDRVLTGVVTGPSNEPIADASVRLAQEIAYAGMRASGSSSESSTVTNAQGEFAIAAFPGSGSLEIVPPTDALKPSEVPVTIPDQVADPSPVPIQLEAIVRETYSGKVVDRAGTGLAGLEVEVSGEDTYHQVETNSAGEFVLMSTATLATRHFVQGSTSSGDNWRIYFPDVDLSNGPVTNVVIPIENRALAGVVTDPGGQPVADVNVEWEQDVDYAAADRGNARSRTTTNASGEFELEVFPGEGELYFAPPEATNLQTRSLEVVVPDQDADPTPVSVALEAVVRETYSGKVVDRNDAPLSGATVEITGEDTWHESVTDGQGDFTIQSTPTPFQRHFVQKSSSSGQNWRIYFPDVDLSQGPVTGVTLKIENRVLTGVVSDPDQRPVANAEISWDQEVDYPGISRGNASHRVNTNAQGQFTLDAFPGIGELHASLPSSDRYAPFSVSDVEISEDQSFAILVQFSTEATNGTVPAGGTVSSDEEGDGATEGDPLETGITLPAGGTASIQEHAISLSPPSGVVFLTQQISISAPAATAEMPYTIEFTIDASRIPAGVAAADLQVFKNGAQVERCVGAAGTALPDPCWSDKTLLPGGDVHITVLTGTASEWNLGVADPDGPCGNDAVDSGEDCDDGNRESGDCCSSTCTYETIGASCNDGDLCSTGDACDGAGECESGSTVVTCSAMGECHEVGVCNPETGTCSNPPKTAGAPCGSSEDNACTDADTCNGAGLCLANDVAACCLEAADCDDGLDCTTDTCGSNNTCGHAIVAGCCDDETDCNDNDACTTDSCNGESNTCSNTEISGCCLIDADCDDDNACTTDSCDASDRTCEHEDVDDCCTDDSQCNDQDPCTTDQCTNTACRHVEISSCEPEEDDAGTPPEPIDAAVEPEPEPDSGTARPDSGSPSERDAGDDAGVDAGSDADGEDGCQCRLSQQRQPVPVTLILFGFVAAVRLGRRRKRN